LGQNNNLFLNYALKLIKKLVLFPSIVTCSILKANPKHYFCLQVNKWDSLLFSVFKYLCCN
jgi:hypothetical protein